MKVEKKLKNAWDIEHDKSKKKNIEKRALALTKKIDRLQAFADQILKR